MYMSKGCNLSTYPISHGNQMNVVAFKRDSSPWKYPDSTTYEVTRTDMLNDFACSNPDPRLMKLLERANPTRWGIFHHSVTPTYYNSLICLLGDVAHAGGPHQGAGAGQCLEDALVLSRVLGRLYQSIPTQTLSTPSPLRTKILEAAFQAYDEIRRPRAQKQVLTSQDCGEVYNLMDPVAGDDMVKSVENLNNRFSWIWQHDLAADVRAGEARFDELIGGQQSEYREEKSARL
jgi:salicylate hydroxylase